VFALRSIFRLRGLPAALVLVAIQACFTISTDPTGALDKYFLRFINLFSRCGRCRVSLNLHRPFADNLFADL